MTSPSRIERAQRLVALEGHYLDSGAWDDWLALYAPDAVFWAPAWRTEAELVEDPDTGLSFVYHASREELQERVARTRTGKSVTTMPMPRTAHFISGLLASEAAGGTVDVHSSWSVMVYDPRTRRQHTFFGRYEHRIGFEGSHGGLIMRKKIILLNDCIPTQLAFNHI